MRYLLDTNICIYIAKKKPQHLLSRFERLNTGDTAMSLVTYLELVYGAYKSERTDDNLSTIQQLVSFIPVLSLDISVAHHYGRVRTELERKGTPIGAYDLMIACHAMSMELTLVTNNTREFSRIPGLRVTDWT